MRKKLNLKKKQILTTMKFRTLKFIAGKLNEIYSTLLRHLQSNTNYMIVQILESNILTYGTLSVYQVTNQTGSPAASFAPSYVFASSSEHYSRSQTPEGGTCSPLFFSSHISQM